MGRGESLSIGGTSSWVEGPAAEIVANPNLGHPDAPEILNWEWIQPKSERELKNLQRSVESEG